MEYTTNEVNIASYSAQPQQLYHQEIFDFFFFDKRGIFNAALYHFILCRRVHGIGGLTNYTYRWM